MQQLFLLGKGKLQWREVVAPRIEGPQEALVRPFAVAKCDLDHAMLFNHIDMKLRIGRLLGIVDPDFERHFGGLFSTPMPFGHECVAEVMEIGESVRSFQVGDVVAVPFQISCGSCPRCLGGHTAVCAGVPPVAVYGFGRHKQYGGAMCDLLKVPFADGMLVPVPVGAGIEHLASLGDNVADAYRHVAPALLENPDQSVLIASGDARSIAIYSVLIARALGARHIAFVDSRAEQRRLALKTGADHVAGSYEGLRENYDLVVDCCASERNLSAAIGRVKPYGTLTSTGWHFRKTRLPLLQMQATGMTFRVGMANARAGAIGAARLIEEGRLSLQSATTQLDTWDDAIDAFLADSTKTIVHRARVHPGQAELHVDDV